MMNTNRPAVRVRVRVRVRDVMKTDFDLANTIGTIAGALSKSQHPESKCFIVNKRHADDEYGIVLYGLRDGLKSS